MPNITFKKEKAEVRVVYLGTRYKIDVSEIDFSQSFQETSFEVKTIHNQSSFEGSVINQANPAEFSLSTPLLKEATNRVMFDRLIDSATFDLYISTKYDVWKLKDCVIQDGTFEINRRRPLRLAISGEASKLSKWTENIPGSDPAATTTTYILPVISTLTFGSDDVSGSIVSLSAELQNDINWNDYKTLQGANAAVNAATSMYPSSYHTGTKVLAGSIAKYLDETSTSVLTWNSSTNLRLVAGNGTQGLDFNIPSCSFTNRMSTADTFREEYNWRMTPNQTALSSVITYTTE